MDPTVRLCEVERVLGGLDFLAVLAALLGLEACLMRPCGDEPLAEGFADVVPQAANILVNDKTAIMVLNFFLGIEDLPS
jgi:hypothetical protein